MADDAPDEPGPADAPASAPAPAAGEKAGEFERYALIAALTLVVLCLLVWDKWQGGGISGGATPRPDRTLRVEIGGGDPDAKPVPPPKTPGDAPHVSNDTPPPKPAPAPAPAPAERTYTVKGGDNLSDIAKHELGAASRAQEIADLNGLADPSKLKLGQVLKLPAK